MKIAICFSGMVRTGVEAQSSIKNFIGELWDSCDFFIHTWNLDYHNVLTGESPEHFGQVHPTTELDISKLKQLESVYNMRSSEIDDYWATMNSLSSLFQNYVKSDQWIIPWFYSWHKSILLKKKHEAMNSFKYDVVVKLRPDVIFNNKLRLKDYIDSLNKDDFGINMIADDWGNMIADDIVFVSSGDIHDRVSDWWIHRLVTGEYQKTDKNTFGYFFDFIKQRGANPVCLDMPYLGPQYKIGLLRQECTIFDPVNEFDKCVECDRLHYHVLNKNEVQYISSAELDILKEKTLQSRKILPTGLQ